MNDKLAHLKARCLDADIGVFEYYVARVNSAILIYVHPVVFWLGFGKEEFCYHDHEVIFKFSNCLAYVNFTAKTGPP